MTTLVEFVGVAFTDSGCRNGTGDGALTGATFASVDVVGTGGPPRDFVAVTFAVAMTVAQAVGMVSKALGLVELQLGKDLVEVLAVVAVVALAGEPVSVGAFSQKWQLDLEVDMVLGMVAP